MFSLIRNINIKINYKNIHKFANAILLVYVVENYQENDIFNDIIKYFSKYYITYNLIEVVQNILFEK